MERCCRKAIVHQVPDISRAIRLKTGSGDDESWEHGKRTLLTEGSNFQSMWEHAHQLVDLNYIRSNDIASILNNYGVEAARASIIREVSDVFGVYAITINYRHLSLIADYMVRAAPLALVPGQSLTLFPAAREPADARGRLQALQPDRYLVQVVAAAQGLVRDDGCLPLGRDPPRRL
jgi:hypothetical protein